MRETFISVRDVPKRIRVARKTDSFWMRLLGWFAETFRIAPEFMRRFWTTIGDTIYAPTAYDTDPDWGTSTWLDRHKTLIAHEGTHVAQEYRYGKVIVSLMVIGPAPFLAAFGLAFHLYGCECIVPTIFFVVAALALPLSIGLAWGRWRLEREAYLVNVRDAGLRERLATIDFVSKTLWRNYLLAWPPSWSTKWFIAELAKEVQDG